MQTNFGKVPEKNMAAWELEACERDAKLERLHDQVMGKINTLILKRRAIAEAAYIERNPDVLVNTLHYTFYIRGLKTYVGKIADGFAGAELLYDDEIKFTSSEQ
ncbi:hypothetical protein [Deefgea sp. CFH1-16]|uniref:hypothetical protein n=1 Tax=Deefgea sp. CFH1-16 TaxID=2675457 RepID=UPI0015F5E988|nr:hypothetical protein [Deefgea sp. CFH1-16]MBM5575823.1 hypothetical protein [Deefgea sp. CFH1-16]